MGGAERGGRTPHDGGGALSGGDHDGGGALSGGEAHDGGGAPSGGLIMIIPRGGGDGGRHAGGGGALTIMIGGRPTIGDHLSRLPPYILSKPPPR